MARRTTSLGQPSVAARGAVTRELTVAQAAVDRFDRLRALAARPGLPAAVRDELLAEAERVVEEVDGVRASFVARLLGVSRPTAYKWLDEGLLEDVVGADRPRRVSLRSALRLRDRLAEAQGPWLRDVGDRLGLDRDTVAQLISGGAVRVRRSGLSADIDDGERDYLLRHGRLLAALADELCGDPAVGTAVLFGSAARGDSDAESDLDLLLDVDFDHAERVRERLQEIAGRAVDIVLLDSAVAQPRLLLPILDEGRPLVARSDRWRRLVDRRRQIAEDAQKDHARVVREGRAAIEDMRSRAPARAAG